MSESTETEPRETNIRLCGPEDRATQAALYDTCFGTEDGATVLPWRYDAGPHGGSVSLLADLDGTPVSGYACSPRRVLHNGDGGALVGQTGDVMTHPDHRKRGIFSGLDRAAMEETKRLGWPAVFGLPNRQSAHIFTRDLGWEEVGRVRPWTFVLALEDSAKAERLKAGRLAAAALPWTFWRGTMRRGKLRSTFFEKVNVVPLPRFEEDVDAVAAEVAKRFPFMVQRDHEYLNWRYVDAPSGLFKAQGVYAPNGSICGYCVVQLPARGERVGYVVDILALDDTAFAAAMEAALGHLHKAAASVARAHAMEGSWWESKLRFSGFRPGKKDEYKIVIAHVHDASHPLAIAAKDPASWYFTDGDRDDELVK